MTRAAALFRRVAHESYASVTGTIQAVVSGRFTQVETSDSPIGLSTFGVMIRRQEGRKRCAIEILSATDSPHGGRAVAAGAGHALKRAGAIGLRSPKSAVRQGIAGARRHVAPALLLC